MVAVAAGVVNALALVVAQHVANKAPVMVASVATMHQAASRQLLVGVAKDPQQGLAVRRPTGLLAKTATTVVHAPRDGMAAAISGHMAAVHLTANLAPWHSATPRFAPTGTKTALSPVATVANQTHCAPALTPWQTVVVTAATATAMVAAVVGPVHQQAAAVVGLQTHCAPVLDASSEFVGG